MEMSYQCLKGRLLPQSSSVKGQPPTLSKHLPLAPTISSGKMAAKSASDPKEENKIFTQNTNMILVMGVTGAGKSYFINTLAGGRPVKEGQRLHACK
jgi:predicted GTPase